jgi:hypothetical protein
MSFLRGDLYVWSDGDRAHLWCADGYDGWNDSGWAQGRPTPAMVPDQPSGPLASGVGIRHADLDAYVVMRLAQLVEAATIGSAIDLALERGRENGGGEALVRLAPWLRATLTQIAAIDGAPNPAFHPVRTPDA